jgi:hypothetical protein
VLGPMCMRVEYVFTSLIILLHTPSSQSEQHPHPSLSALSTTSTKTATSNKTQALLAPVYTFQTGKSILCEPLLLFS